MNGFSTSTLKARVFRGGAWLGTGSFGEQGFRFARNLILTRLLAPEAFGTMAIVLSTASILQALTEVGAKEALIQNPKGNLDEYIGAAWWLSFGRSVSVYLMLFAAAPLIARFYGNAQLTSLLRIATMGLLFEGTMSGNAYIAIKQMKFGRWAIINHGGAILGILTTLLLSVFLRNIWALAWGAFSEGLAKFLLSYIVCPYLPPLKWHSGAFRELVRFSRGVFGLPFLNLIFIRADVFVLAKLCTATNLGLYAMAIYLVQTPTMFLMNLLGQTLLPALSQVQADNARLNRIVFQVTSVLILIGMPALIFAIFCGGSVLTLAYGQRYGIAAASLVAAAGVALLNILNGQITTIFYAKGLPQLHRTCVAIMAGIMAILVYPLSVRFGLAGGQLAALVAILAGLTFQVFRVRNVTGMDLSGYPKVVSLALGVCVFVAALSFASHSITNSAKPLANVLVGAFGCAIACHVSVKLFLRPRFKEAI